MSVCAKHPVRKRKDCPDCMAELNSPVGILDDPRIIAKVKEVEKTLTVIKDIKAEEVIVKAETSSLDNILTVEKLIEEPEVEMDLEEYRNIRGQELKDQVDLLVKKKLKDVEKEINKMLSVKHECLDVPLCKFNMKVLESLLADGWKLITFLTKDVAKASGFKEDIVLLQRIKCDSWKKDLDTNKLRFKEAGKLV